MAPVKTHAPALALRICALTLLASLILTFLLTSPAAACEGHPPPPLCAKSLVLSQAAPSLLLIPGGGTFDVPVTVYFQLFDFPSGSGICPAGPYTVDVTLTVTCTPTGDGVGSALSAPISVGYNDLDISITLPPGPPRLCSVDGTAVTTLADGMELTATNDSVLCIGDPAPGNPTLPRLDFERIAGDAIAKVHPGDQTGHTYRVTNNDPVETFNGNLMAEMVNSSRTPGMSGPAPPGTGVFAISDPGLSDNFPIGLAGDLFGTCLPLPPDPSLPIVPTIIEPFTLLPGESIELDIFARPWGMCADGSCGRTELVVEGLFSDQSAGQACSGFVTAADISVPPSFAWSDSGQVGLFQPPIDPAAGLLPIQGQPFPGLPLQLEMLTLPPLMGIDGAPPLPIQPQFTSGIFNPERGRTQMQLQDPEGLFPADSFFDIVYRVDFQPQDGSTPQVETQMIQMDLVQGAPTGLENLAPFGMGLLGIQPIDAPDFLAFGQLTYQVSGQAIDETGAERELLLEQVVMHPTPDGRGIDVHLSGVVGEGLGTTIMALNLFGDPRFYFSRRPAPGPIFEDDFNAGDTLAWSVTIE